ncbi:MAG: chaperone NapD [Magnetococcales bacterium]|nr:chaperone NapD [Magnetococcales bacterium]
MKEDSGSFALASALVLVRPDRLREITTQLGTFPGVDVHLASEQGKMIITLEGPESEPLADILTEIKHLDGVLSVDLVYQHFEEATAPHRKETVL